MNVSLKPQPLEGYKVQVSGKTVAYAYSGNGRIDWLPRRCCSILLTDLERRKVMVEVATQLNREVVAARTAQEGVKGGPPADNSEPPKIVLPEGTDGDD